MDYCPSFVKNVKHFIMLNIFWLLLVLLGCTTIIQAEPNYQIPQYWSNENLLWIKPVNVEQKYPKISDLWPSTNGLIRVGYYSDNPASPIPHQASKMFLTNLYGLSSGNDNDYNTKVITQYQEDMQHNMEMNYDNSNKKQNSKITEKPKRNGPYLAPCYFKICNIAG